MKASPTPNNSSILDHPRNSRASDRQPSPRNTSSTHPSFHPPLSPDSMETRFFLNRPRDYPSSLRDRSTTSSTPRPYLPHSPPNLYLCSSTRPRFRHRLPPSPPNFSSKEKTTTYPWPSIHSPLRPSSSQNRSSNRSRDLGEDYSSFPSNAPRIFSSNAARLSFLGRPVNNLCWEPIDPPSRSLPALLPPPPPPSPPPPSSSRLLFRGEREPGARTTRRPPRNKANRSAWTEQTTRRRPCRSAIRPGTRPLLRGPPRPGSKLTFRAAFFYPMLPTFPRAPLIAAPLPSSLLRGDLCRREKGRGGSSVSPSLAFLSLDISDD